MGKVRRSTLLGLTFLLLFVAGCKVSCTTANISSLKISKDKEGNVQTTEFVPGDKVYATTTISNNGSTVTVKFRTYTDKVEGMSDNTPLPGSDVSVDVPGSAPAYYNITIPPSGLPSGRYRIEAVMLYNGEQKDKKTGTFTVKGGSGGAPPGPEATPSIPPGGTTPTDDDDMNNRENSNTHEEH